MSRQQIQQAQEMYGSKTQMHEELKMTSVWKEHGIYCHESIGDDDCHSSFCFRLFPKRINCCMHNDFVCVICGFKACGCCFVVYDCPQRDEEWHDVVGRRTLPLACDFCDERVKDNQYCRGCNSTLCTACRAYDKRNKSNNTTYLCVHCNDLLEGSAHWPPTVKVLKEHKAKNA